MTADDQLSDQDWAVWRDFMTMSGQLSRELDRRLQADAGISHADYSVLLVLQQASDHQLRTGELAELLAWEKSRVSHQVARMEARALVARSECDTDGRGTWIEPTPEGRRVLLGAMRNHNRTIRELFFDVLGDDQRVAIGDAALNVLDRLSPEGCVIAEEKGMSTSPPSEGLGLSAVGASTAGASAGAGTVRYDVAIIGGGHNGLTAAAYLAQAGKRVIVLERLDQFGGAAVSAQAFPGVDAQLSRYSYLVSLLPQRIIDELKLDIRLARRRYSSYTPLPGTSTGLLVDTGDPVATHASFESIGAAQDAAAWSSFYDGTARLARSLFPTVTEPLMTRSESRRMLGDDALWNDLIEQPIGSTIESRFADDLVRGVVLTDGLIGTFAPAVDPSLAANRCFLYHVIGGGTGDWDVPIGGMGAVSSALRAAARDAGAELLAGADVTTLTPDGEVSYVRDDAEHRLVADTVLANVAPFELARLLGESASRPEGAQGKVNLLLTRLPRLRDQSLDPAAAFGGTFHANEGFARLGSAYDDAVAGRIPDPLPVEIYCHSLTDPSILSPELRAAGAQTLTVFALQTPHRLLTEANNDARRSELEAAVLRSLDAVLAEPIESLVMTNAEGRTCLETKTTLDLEHALRMPGGNIFHGPLSWPFAEDDAPRQTPAERWGVATTHPRILLCGAGAQRGGAVSGLGGHNAAMAVLEAD